MQVKWLSQAISDLDSHIEYIANRKPSAAIEKLEIIEGAISNLANSPEAGQRGRVSGTFELAIDGTPFIIVYKIHKKNNFLQILRILHSSQMWP